MSETTARQIALYLYLEQHNGERPDGVTLQQIANATGGPHRSNIKREIEEVTASREQVKEYLEALQNLKPIAVQSNQEDMMEPKQKYTVQHTGYPVAGRPIDESEWETLSTHETESAAHKRVSKATEHLDYGQWDDHYRVIGPDGQRLSRDAWLMQEDEKRIMREYKKSRS